MRLAQVRIAAVSLVSGGVLALGVLGGAQAAQLKPQATVLTDIQCQALPVSATASPSPSPSPRPSLRHKTAPPPSPSPSESTSVSPSPSTSPSGSPTPSTSSGGPSAGPSLQSPASSQPASVARASLDAYIATSPSPSPSSPSPSSPSPTGTATPSASAAATPPPELCVSVQRAQASITRGHTATYLVRVSTRNASAMDVNVALTAQPTSQKATFTKGCTKGDGTNACTVSAVKVKQPAVLQARIAVAPGATSVRSVKLTATASIVTTQKWKAPTVAATTAVTSIPARARKPKLLEPVPLPALPLGPIPDLNGAGSTLIKAGNATQLFPVITPSPGPSATAAAHPRPTRRRTEPVSDSRALSAGSPLLPARIAGLILLALAIVLTITRLSLRRWPGSGRPRG